MRPERGFSLLELLIACTILAIALLGIGLLALRALQDAASLRDHALAELLLADLRNRAALVGPEQLEANLANAGLAADEFRRWRAQVTSLLPSPRSELCRDSTRPSGDSLPLSCDGAGPLVIRLAWRRAPLGSAEWRQEPVEP